MSSQGSNSQKISQKDNALACTGYQEALRILEEDTLLARKLDSLHIVATKYVPTISQNSLEAEILQYLMPHARELLLSIFERAIDLAMNSVQECAETLSTLKEYMQMAINLLQILDGLLDFVIRKNKIKLSDVQSLPVNISKMLCSTFLHCKESQNFYNVYFDSLNEIVTLFKQAQDVHTKLLKVLDVHISFNFVFEDDLLCFKLVLETLVEIGGILADMNVKSMVLNFKAYIMLVNKHASGLTESFSIRQPFNFLSKEIIKNLETITQWEECEEKNVPQTIKLVNFLLKLMLKLCSLFWQSLKSCFVEVWDFLSLFYSFFDTQLAFKGVDQKTIELIKSQVFDYVDPFLTKLCKDADFMQITNFKDVVHNNHHFGFLVLINILFKKLSQNECADLCRAIDFSSVLQLVFETVSKCYIEIITDDRIYENLVATTSAFILLNVNNHQYFKVESVLYKNLLGQNIWCSLIAADIWSLILSSCSSHYKFETLTCITEGSRNIMKSNFTHSPNFVVLCIFIKQLYQISPTDVKLKFIERFPPGAHMYIWKHIGFVNVPDNSSFKMSSLLQALMEKMERFDADRCTCEEFISMCEYLDAVSTINFEEVYLDVNKMSLLVLKLWDFDAGNSALLDNSFFKFFIWSLCSLTNSLMWKWNNTQLLQILQQLMLLFNTNTSMKLLILNLLDNTSTKFIENSTEQFVINSVLSEFFTVLFNDSNCVIRQDTLKIFVAFINYALHGDVVHNSLNGKKNLQEKVSNFMQKKTVSNIEECCTFLKSLSEKKFVHQCTEWSNSWPQTKKLKVQNTEAVTVLRRMKSDVNYFCQICEKNDLTREDLCDISYVLGQLQSFV